MSYYNKYTFVSPEPIFAIIREELKSYWDTGVIDDLLFNTYLDKCLQKLGLATFDITESILDIEDYQARLPDNFVKVREAWMCTDIAGYPYQSPSAFYAQAASATTIQVAPMVVNGQPCNVTHCTDGCDDCMPNVVQAVYKTTNEVARTIRRLYLLKPGNVPTKELCTSDYMSNWSIYGNNANTHSPTPYSSSYDSFDIRGNKFTTNFREGVVHLVFYVSSYDGSGNQLIPDNYRIKEYIEAYLKYKMFETISNQVTDETFNQIQQKLTYYKQLSDEAYIIAEVEIKKQGSWDKQRRILQTINRHKMYELPTGRKYRRIR